MPTTSAHRLQGEIVVSSRTYTLGVLTLLCRSIRDHGVAATVALFSGCIIRVTIPPFGENLSRWSPWKVCCVVFWMSWNRALGCQFSSQASCTSSSHGVDLRRNPVFTSFCTSVLFFLLCVVTQTFTRRLSEEGRPCVST